METPAPYTPLKQDDQCCENCRSGSGDDECLRCAPTPHLQLDSRTDPIPMPRWAITREYDWCGEWESVAEYELKRTTAIHIPAPPGSRPAMKNTTDNRRMAVTLFDWSCQTSLVMQKANISTIQDLLTAPLWKLSVTARKEIEHRLKELGL